jgi:hypothetical protein
MAQKITVNFVLHLKKWTSSTTGLEHQFIMRYIKRRGEDLSFRNFQHHYQTARLALRYSILSAITSESYRKLSRHVADKAMAQKLLYQNTALKFDAIFADTTCVKADIHFPVDWVLLRDATRTLIQAIIVIRNHGIKYRIDDPQHFLREMNKLCMEMTQTRKNKDSAKMRKKIFRRMKKLMSIIEQHANNYYRELEARWQETDWSELETQVVLNKLRNILDQLPQADKQVHERIIGERRVANKDKILSLYDSDIRVLLRGKADAEVEFCNALYIAEQADGLIVEPKHALVFLKMLTSANHYEARVLKIAKHVLSGAF